MYQAVTIANSNKCDIVISNHVNVGGGKGFEGFYSRMALADDIAKGKKIYDKLTATKSCLAARRYCSDFSYKGYDLYVLKQTAMTAFLFEIGFVYNADDVLAVNDDEVARAYAEGIASAYGLTKKVSNTNVGGNVDMNKIVTYLGDADVFAAVIVSQKLNCPMMKVSAFKSSGLKVNEVIQIGGNSGDTDRYSTMKNASNEYL